MRCAHHLRPSPVGCAILAALILLAVAPGARAERPATADEFAAIVAAVEQAGRLPVTCDSPPVALGADDLEVSVSGRDPAWAALRSDDACELNDGWVLAHDAGDGAWQFVVQGAEDATQYCAAVAPTVPALVGEELGLCQHTPAGVQLGAFGIHGAHGHGWGEVRPALVSSGAGLDRLARNITWRNWGGPTATGTGRVRIRRPGGAGYFVALGRIVLQASRIGRCVPGGQLTYRRLTARAAVRPGGPLGRTFVWSANLCR